MKCVKLSALMIALSTMSACGQPERPRTVSDFCLIDKTISMEPAPQSGANDVGNKWDSEQTVQEVLTHNAVHRSTCTTPSSP